MSDQLQSVLQKIDALNAQDPNTTEVDGQHQAYELTYSEWVTQWVQQLNPDASELLLIAARGQHVERWKLPRSEYEMTRKGYLLWREDLKKMHAETTSNLMQAAGYDEDAITTVQDIMLKKRIRNDADTQTLEDALCLVFLEHQFTELREKTAEDKMIEILQKTWRKMSQQGRDAALQLDLPEANLALVQKALA